MRFFSCRRRLTSIWAAVAATVPLGLCAASLFTTVHADSQHQPPLPPLSDFVGTDVGQGRELRLELDLLGASGSGSFSTVSERELKFSGTVSAFFLSKSIALQIDTSEGCRATFNGREAQAATCRALHGKLLVNMTTGEGPMAVSLKRIDDGKHSEFHFTVQNWPALVRDITVKALPH